MTRPARLLAGSAILAIGLCTFSPVVAQTDESSDASKENVLVTVRIGKLEGDRKVPLKSYDLIVAAGTVGSRLLSGARVPIPTAAGDPASGAGGDAMKSFVYQNIGFVTDVKAWIVDKRKIRLVAEIEDSRIREGAEGDPPIVETRQLNVNAILTDGVPLELTRVQGLTDHAGFVEVEARILH